MTLSDDVRHLNKESVGEAAFRNPLGRYRYQRSP